MWDDIFNKVGAQDSTALDLYKGRLKKDPAKSAPKSHFIDPFALNTSVGYKDHRYSPSFEILKAIPGRLALISAILQTRCNQIAAFSTPFRMSKSVGFQIRHKDVSRHPTANERKFINELEDFVYNCGRKEPNKFYPKKRDSFEDLLKKIVRDSLVLDQVCIEVVPDRMGRPYEFLAVDASTIRLAAPGILDPEMKKDRQKESIDLRMDNFAKNKNEIDLKDPAYVQLVDGKVMNTYTYDELIFAIRNPSTDIRTQGYGKSELEMIINTITAHLYAEDYNRRAFSQGSLTQGILNFKGDVMTTEQLEAFKREWRDTVEGVSNAFRTPILQAEAGIEWINLRSSNREMEYGQWIEYLVKMVSAAYLIDPAELNFDLHGGTSNTPLFESSQEWKLKASRDKGLRPLLRFIAKIINDHIISKIDDNYVLTFEGLDELTEKEKHELRKEQVASYYTLNEIRAAEDRPPLPYGDVVLNPTYMQAITVQQQAEQAAQQAGSNQQPGQQPQGMGGQGMQDQQQDEEGEQNEEHIPSYSM
jgi:Phage portal protein